MPRRTNQRFQHGDLVQLEPMIPWFKSTHGKMVYHDYSGQMGVVKASYRDQFGGGEREGKIYTVLFERLGSVSWVDEGMMSLIGENRHDLIEEWSKED